MDFCRPYFNDIVDGRIAEKREADRLGRFSLKVCCPHPKSLSSFVQLASQKGESGKKGRETGRRE